MKVYRGWRTDEDCVVTVDGAPLRVWSDLSGSTAGFDWGYVGNGQLALALLTDLLGDPARAKALYQQFERAVVAELPHDSWTVTEEELASALGALSDPDSPARPPAGLGGVASSGDAGHVGFGDMPIHTGDLVSSSDETGETDDGPGP